MKFILVILVLTPGIIARVWAQSPVTDQQLLAERNFQDKTAFLQYNRPGNSAKTVRYRHRSWVAQYNPVSLALKGALLGYQRLMSQQLARSCPYQLTCSNFSKQAIEQYGLVKGLFLSTDRIMRCNRIGLLEVLPMDVSAADGTIIDSLSRYR